MWDYSPTLSTFRRLPINVRAPEERVLCTIFTKLSAFMHVYRQPLFFGLFRWIHIQPSYKHLPLMGAFSHKFSIALAAKLLIEFEKVGRCKNGTDGPSLSPRQVQWGTADGDRTIYCGVRTQNQWQRQDFFLGARSLSPPISFSLPPPLPFPSPLPPPFPPLPYK